MSKEYPRVQYWDQLSSISLSMTLFSFIKQGILSNYADDNTISVAHNSFNSVIRVLSEETAVAIDWFECNLMQANPNKFQVKLLNHNQVNLSVTVGNKTIAAAESVKLLGVNIDNNLNFTSHTQELCQKLEDK